MYEDEDIGTFQICISVPFNCEISQLYVTLKTFMLVFYNSFLKIKLNCDKENMLFLNICSFQKRMLSEHVF